MTSEPDHVAAAAAAMPAALVEIFAAHDTRNAAARKLTNTIARAIAALSAPSTPRKRPATRIDDGLTSSPRFTMIDGDVTLYGWRCCRVHGFLPLPSPCAPGTRSRRARTTPTTPTDRTGSRTAGRCRGGRRATTPPSSEQERREHQLDASASASPNPLCVARWSPNSTVSKPLRETSSPARCRCVPRDGRGTACECIRNLGNALQ